MKSVKKMKRVNKQRQDQGINSLGVDLLERILCLLPLKSRTRLMCVSKIWCTAIINYLRPSTSSSGLVILSKEVKYGPGPELNRRGTFFQVTFLAAEDYGSCTEVKSIVIDCPIPSTFFYPLLAHSQNGMLLIRDSVSPRLFLCNPLLAHIPGAVFTELPPLLDHLGHRHCGLFFDASSKNQYKVLLFSMNSDCFIHGKVFFHTLSSESNDWEQHEAALIKPSSSHRKLSLTPERDFSKCAPCVCYNGNLYWLFRKFVMAYSFDEQFFEVISLPSNFSSPSVELKYFYSQNGLLWESESKLYYCETAKGGFSLWTYNGHGEAVEDDDGNHWMFKRWIPFKMSKDDKDMYYAIRDDDNICPFAFNDEMQMLYFHDQISTVYFYSFETQRLSRSWYGHEKKRGTQILMGYCFPVGLFR